jgi:hypothetical protein
METKSTKTTAELIQLYHATPAGPERDQLYWSTPELQQIYSAAMHAPKAAAEPAPQETK